MNELIIYTDGASKGNPGKAGAGVVFKNGKGQIIGEFSWYLGVVTNNEAEYTAILMALQLVSALDIKDIRIRSDSLLMVNQLNGEWTVKHKTLKTFFAEIRRMLYEMETHSFITIMHIPREQNKEADTLANKAIADFEKGPVKE